MGPCLYDVPQPEGVLRRLTMASALGLVVVLRIIPLGDNVALGEMVQRVLSASSTPRKVFREGDFIDLCEQRLQRVTGLKPLKSTNALPPAWQFSLSWGGVSDEEKLSPWLARRPGC